MFKLLTAPQSIYLDRQRECVCVRGGGGVGGEESGEKNVGIKKNEFLSIDFVNVGGFFFNQFMLREICGSTHAVQIVINFIQCMGLLVGGGGGGGVVRCLKQIIFRFAQKMF